VKSYVIGTGVIFGLLTVVHVWRMVDEPELATQPWFLAITAASAALSVRRASRDVGYSLRT
jgi:hypothetical protein